MGTVVCRPGGFFLTCVYLYDIDLLEYWKTHEGGEHRVGGYRYNSNHQPLTYRAQPVAGVGIGRQRWVRKYAAPTMAEATLKSYPIL